MHSKEILRRNTAGQSVDMSTTGATTLANNDRLTIMQSAMTPSVAKLSRATSTDHDNFHMSNPNPQRSLIKFKGPRDMTSTVTSGSGADTESQIDFLRFGKRVSFGAQVSNAEVLETHL